MHITLCCSRWCWVRVSVARPHRDGSAIILERDAKTRLSPLRSAKHQKKKKRVLSRRDRLPGNTDAFDGLPVLSSFELAWVLLSLRSAVAASTRGLSAFEVLSETPPSSSEEFKGVGRRTKPRETSSSCICKKKKKVLSNMVFSGTRWEPNVCV